MSRDDPFLDGSAFEKLLDRPASPNTPHEPPSRPPSLRLLADTAQAVLRRYRGTWLAIAGNRTVTQDLSTGRFTLRTASTATGSTSSLDAASTFLRHRPLPSLIVLPPRAGTGLRHAILPGEPRTLCGKNAELWLLDTKGGPPGCSTCSRIASILNPEPP